VLFDAVECAITWGVRRMTVASTIGVCGGVSELRGASALQPTGGGNLCLPVIVAHAGGCRAVISGINRATGAKMYRAMARWEEVERSEPEFAARVRALFDAHKHKTIATLRLDGAPRISGIEANIEDGQLTF